MQSIISAKPYLFTAEQYVGSDVPENTELLEGLIYNVSPSAESAAFIEVSDTT